MTTPRDVARPSGGWSASARCTLRSSTLRAVRSSVAAAAEADAVARRSGGSSRLTFGCGTARRAGEDRLVVLLENNDLRAVSEAPSRGAPGPRVLELLQIDPVQVPLPKPWLEFGLPAGERCWALQPLQWRTNPGEHDRAADAQVLLDRAHTKLCATRRLDAALAIEQVSQRELRDVSVGGVHASSIAARPHAVEVTHDIPEADRLADVEASFVRFALTGAKQEVRSAGCTLAWWLSCRTTASARRPQHAVLRSFLCRGQARPLS